MSKTDPAHRKKYVRFRWWQYRQWMVVIVFITFCLGVATGFIVDRLWTAWEKAQAPLAVESVPIATYPPPEELPESAQEILNKGPESQEH